MSEEAVYKTPGKIDVSTNPQVSEDLKDLMAEGNYHIVIDMKDTVYISSVGLRTLLQTQKECKSHEGSLVIRNAGDMVLKVMDVTGFSSILTIE